MSPHPLIHSPANLLIHSPAMDGGVDEIVNYFNYLVIKDKPPVKQTRDTLFKMQARKLRLEKATLCKREFLRLQARKLRLEKAARCKRDFLRLQARKLRLEKAARCKREFLRLHARKLRLDVVLGRNEKDIMEIG